MATNTVDEDVVDLLLRQHGEIRSLFVTLEVATGNLRRDTFRDLVRLLAIHETAEEEVVHPAARSAAGGHEVVEARLAEERSAKEILAELDKLGPDDEGFTARLSQLRDEVEAHARHEEQEEFPRLREQYDDRKLRTMAKAVRAAEAIAPTHPHPGVEGTAENLLLGPPTAIMDRARDLIRDVLKK
ncbi:hemerythrin domain-containing protein [Kribbella sancticallisti]|uniref:Hemerythrin domain-containing protein n=1 Tax=Kribbella sancticallisti TaxID=460087 RepID=A0ABN2DBR1_9ACTN